MGNFFLRREVFELPHRSKNAGPDFRFAVLSLFFLTAVPVFSFGGDPGTAAALFLREDPSARGFAMGGVYLPLINSPGAAYLNPAALGHITGHHVELSMWKGLDAVSQYSFAGAVISSRRSGVFNVNYLNYNTGTEDVYDLNDNLSKVTLQKDYAVSAGWGKNLGEIFFVGGQLKRVNSVLAQSYSASALTFDAGVMYKSLDDKVTIGAGARNMGGSLKYKNLSDPLPRSVTGEAGYRWPLYEASLTAGLSVQKSLGSNTIDSGIGLEYCSSGIPLVLRAGLREMDGEVKAAAGIGVALKGVTVDYGFSAAGQFAGTEQRFSLSVNFGPENDSQREAVYRDRGFKRKPAAMAAAAPKKRTGEDDEGDRLLYIYLGR